MKLHPYSPGLRNIILIDGEGNRLRHVLFVDTETRELHQTEADSYGDPILRDDGDSSVKSIHPHPIHLYSTRLGCYITSQLQLDFLARSYRSALAAHHRWVEANRRANRQFDFLALNYGCPLGKPSIATDSFSCIS